MKILGLQKTSLVDYPEEICATVFAGGCNLRCRYCHNRDLVTNSHILPPVPSEYLWSFLEERAPLLGGVCISGGEPTLQEGLPELIRQIKKLGLKVKLDTNGTRPEVLEELTKEGLLDYVAVDIKGPWDKYFLITGREDVLESVKQTTLFLLENSLAYEFRTTVVPSLLDGNDLVNISQQLQGAKKYVLQQFRPKPGVLDPDLEMETPYAPEQMMSMASSCKKYVRFVQVRGL